jgi:hypothetical protein
VQKSSFTSKFLAMGVLIGAVVFLGGLASATPDPAGGPVMTGSSPTPEKSLQVQETFGRLPLYFIENRGQVDKRVKFYAQSGGQTTWFTKEGVVVTLTRRLEPPGRGRRLTRPSPRPPALKTAAVGLTPVGLRKGVKVAALEPQEHKVNYIFGNNPKKWLTDVPTYQAVAYQEAYKGIDLKFYGDGRQLEYDIIVKPGADPGQVKFRYAGVKSLEVTPSGDLAIRLPDGEVLVQKKPVVYQEIAGTRVAREGKFKLHGNLAGHTYGFEVAAYNKQASLIIDPVLVYSNNLGGSNAQAGHAIRVDAEGCAYVAGVTASTDFPTVNWIKQGSGVEHAHSYFVTKFNAQGNGLIYSTYLRGNTKYDGTPANDQYGMHSPPYDHLGLAVDTSGCAYITGPTWSLDFPTTPPGSPNYPPAYTYAAKNATANSFVTKLAAAGNSLVYSTYMRGSYDSPDYARDIALGESGTVYVGGSTESGNLNGTGLHIPVYTEVAFVTKLNAGGTAFIWTMALVADPASGGAYGPSGAFRIVAEPYNSLYPYSGGVWVTGWTLDGNFPLLHPLQSAMGQDIWKTAFLTWVDSGVGTTPGTIRFSTYWGGTSPWDVTEGLGIARGGNGDIFVCGHYNWGQDDPILPNDTRTYPTSPNALKPSMGFDGRPQADFPNGFYTCQNAILFRVTNRWLYTPLPGGGFYTRLNPQLVYSTYFGGEYQDLAYAVAADKDGNAYLTGDSFSYKFPLKNPLYTTLGNNIFVSKIGYNQAANKMFLGYSTFIGESCGGPEQGGYSIVVDDKHQAYVAGAAQENSNVFPRVNAVSSPGIGVMVFKLRDTMALPWLMLLLD